MKTFDIYIPSKFYWPRTRIIYVIITVLILACLAVKYLFLVVEEGPIYRYFGYTIFGVFAFGFCCAIWGMPGVKPIAGKLEGTIRFEEEGI